MSSLFNLRGSLSTFQRAALGIGGVVVVLLIWTLLTMGADPFLPQAILPSPWSVVKSYGSLYHDNDLVQNTLRSVALNLAGYLEAIVIALPLGFLIGLYPIFRGGFQRQIDAIRYLPLTALTGLFIIWFGLGSTMKIHFLAFGILIYLLPIVVQRIDEVKDVYLKTVYTLGASDWQTIRTVYMPSVLSRLWDDIRVLTAISWTYIIIAEMMGNQGGIGSLIWRTGQRQGRVDKVFAILIIIILIGIIQDKLFLYLDRKMFPHKYQITDVQKGKFKSAPTLAKNIWSYVLEVFAWAGIAIYLFFFVYEFLDVPEESKVLSNLFGDPVWVIHFIFFVLAGFKIYKLIKRVKTKA